MHLKLKIQTISSIHPTDQPSNRHLPLQSSDGAKKMPSYVKILLYRVEIGGDLFFYTDLRQAAILIRQNSEFFIFFKIQFSKFEFSKLNFFEIQFIFQNLIFKILKKIIIYICHSKRKTIKTKTLQCIIDRRMQHKSIHGPQFQVY